MTETQTRVSVDAYFIALNETPHYAIDDDDRPHIVAIRGVYVLDRNERVHCCEMTPSYYLIHCYDIVEVTPDTSDEMRDLLHEKYGLNGGDNLYVHCRSIDSFITKGDRTVVYHYGDPEVSDDDVEHDDQMEALREHFCGNCPL